MKRLRHIFIPTSGRTEGNEPRAKLNLKNEKNIDAQLSGLVRAWSASAPEQNNFWQWSGCGCICLSALNLYQKDQYKVK